MTGTGSDIPVEILPVQAHMKPFMEKIFESGRAEVVTKYAGVTVQQIGFDQDHIHMIM